MAKIRMFEIAKLLGVKTSKLIELLHEKDINKTNFAKVDGDDLACMCHLFFQNNVQLPSIQFGDCNKTIIEMAQYPKYHNTLKFLVHMISDKDKRKIVMGQIALINPYLATQVLMTICENIEEERVYLLEILKQLYSLSENKFIKYLLIMAILNLDKNEEIEMLFKKQNELMVFCNMLTTLEHFYIDTEKQLALIELFIKFRRFKAIDIVLKDMENTDNFDKMQNEKAVNISKQLEHIGHFGLSNRLLIMAGLKQAPLDAFNNNVKDKNVAFKFAQKPKQLLNFENGIGKRLSFNSLRESNEQYYSFIKDENNFLKDNKLKSGLLKEYVYIKENGFNNKESAAISYDVLNLFNVCLHKYKSEDNFVRLYFNSPLKLGVKFEYLVEKLKVRFNCKNKKIKFILKEYLIKGKISEINESYITIKPLNLNTGQECRMILNGCVLQNDKQKEFLQKNRICYFMFDFMKEVNNRKIIFVQWASA